MLMTTTFTGIVVVMMVIINMSFLMIVLPLLPRSISKKHVKELATERTDGTHGRNLEYTPLLRSWSHRKCCLRSREAIHDPEGPT